MGAVGVTVGVAAYGGLQVAGVCEGYQHGPSDEGYFRSGTQCGDWDSLKVQIEQTGRTPPLGMEDPDPNGEERGVRFFTGSDAGRPWRLNASSEMTHIRGKQEVNVVIFTMHAGKTTENIFWVPIESDLVIPGGE